MSIEFSLIMVNTLWLPTTDIDARLDENYCHYQERYQVDQQITLIFTSMIKMLMIVAHVGRPHYNLLICLPVHFQYLIKTKTLILPCKLY